MKVSIVVPLFNCLPLTQAMVESLGASLPRGLDHEILLVDDGSTDGTREWLAGLRAPFRAVLNESNLGYAAANNRGAAIADGGLLAFLNNDLILDPGWLEPMIAALRSLGTRAGLIGNVQRAVSDGRVDHIGIFINSKAKPEHDRRPPWLAGSWFRPVREVAALTGACFLVEGSTWRRLGGFDEGFRNGCEDVDLCLRAQAAGLVNAVALRSVVRHHVSSSPGRKLRDEENTRRLVLRWHHTLARLAIRAWTRADFERILPDPRDFPDPAEAWHTAAYLLRVRPDAPAHALPGVLRSIDGELARWDSLLGPLPPDSPGAAPAPQPAYIPASGAGA